MRAGGVLDGVRVVMALAVTGKNACCDRMVVVNDWRFVLGTTSNVHVIAPVVVGSPSRSMVTVPVHVPARKDDGSDGAMGLGDPPPQPAPTAIAPSRTQCVYKRLVMPPLLCQQPGRR